MAEMSRAEELVKKLEVLPEDERATALAAACSDDHELRERVESLLQQGTRTSDYQTKSEDAELPSTAGHVPAAPGPVPRAGFWVEEKYQLVKVIGEGGMGSVWLANQTEPVKRQVAIKLTKAGEDSRHVVARFESERQALAVMNHPHVAKILDGGTVSGLGVPFFVMELVNGVPITRFCDEHRLSTLERLRLFIPVCEAIQHAHQKGLIHRDIKPSNILVEMNDGRPVPKVIDFGVAKALGSALTDTTLDTAFGAIVGTPQYMSPEQAEANPTDIDTRSDVYSLGIVLYELLTGSPPFDARRLGRAAILEILRIIREVDPPTPSSKLSTDEGLPSISAKRNTEPARLTRLIRGELDWIVMRALEKDRARRYESASDFAQDIRRYLAGEQVLAAPPSRWYRWRKFLRTHRKPVLAAALVAMALVLGIIGTSLGFLRADTQRELAVAAEAKASRQREQAEIATAQAFAALQSFTDEFVERQFAAKSRLTDNDRAILLKTLAQWEQFARSRGDSAQARDIRAEGAHRVARLRQRLGESAAAETGFRSALKTLKKLVSDHPAEQRYRLQLAVVHQNLGGLLRSLGRYDEALAEMNSALGEIRQLVAATPDSVEYRQSEANIWSAQGVVLRASGKLQEAEAAYQQGRTIQAELVAAHPGDVALRQALGVSHNNQGNLSLSDGDLERASEHFRAGLEIRRQLTAENPGSLEWQYELALSHYGLADLESRRGDPHAALESYRLALDLALQAHARQPLVPEYRELLAALHLNVGTMLRRLGDDAEALRSYRQAVDVRERLAVDFPDRPDYLEHFAQDLLALGRLLLETDQLDAAGRELARARQVLERRALDDPTDRDVLASLANCREIEGQFAARGGDANAAQAGFDESLRLRLKLVRDFPQEVKYSRDLVATYMRRGEFQLARRNATAAIQEYQAAAELGEQLVKQPRAHADHSVFLLRTRLQLASLFASQAEPSKAREQYELAVEVGEKLVARLPAVASHRSELAGTHTNFSLLLEDLHEPEESARHLELAIKLLEQLVAEKPGDLGFRVQLSGCQINRAGQIRAANPAAALEVQQQAILRLEAVVAEKPNDPQAGLFLRNGIQGRATTLDSLQRYPEAARDWERLAEQTAGSEKVLYVSKTAQSLVRAGETTRAIELAESLADVNQAPTIFARARVFALAYGTSRDEAHARRSVELLRLLLAMGFNDAQRLRTDPDLAAIREYEGLLSLIAEIEKL